jgi:transcriptional regulator GlxA family with amidase domain
MINTDCSVDESGIKIHWPEMSLICPVSGLSLSDVCKRNKNMAHTKIVFLILPHVHMLDLAGADQVFYEAKDYGADISIHYCGSQDDISSSSMFPIGKLKHFSTCSLQAGDYLFIPGADIAFLNSPVFAEEQELFTWIRKTHEKGAYVCSVCTGAFVLGLSGLLNGRKCTTHWKRTEQLKKKFPAIRIVEDTLFTEDERVLTSAGVTAGIDLALFTLARLSSDYVSHKVARELVVYMRRNGNESQHSIFMQYRNHIHSGIHKVQDYLQENIQKKTSLERLADKACMSTRSLTRTFKKETGITVNEFATLIRKNLLRELARNPDMSRKQMARRCGLTSERQVIRLMNTIP